MIIEKKIFYKVDDDDIFQIYDNFSCYCEVNDIEENYNNFLKYFTDECIEDLFDIKCEEYDNIDDKDTRFLFYKEMMEKYNKDYILIQKLEDRKKELEQKYRQIEKQIEQIKHKYDL